MRNNQMLVAHFEAVKTKMQPAGRNRALWFDDRRHVTNLVNLVVMYYFAATASQRFAVRTVLYR